MTWIHVLTEEEQELRLRIGRQYREYNVAVGAREGSTKPEKALLWQVTGVGGEISVMRMMGLEVRLNECGNYESLDVGGIIEVRTITQRHYQLRIQPKDLEKKTPDGRAIPVVLVHTPDGITYEALGWCPADPGLYAGWKGWWEERYSAWLVPQLALFKMDALESYLRKVVSGR